MRAVERLAALALVLRAAARLAVLYPRRSLDELVLELRDVQPLRGAPCRPEAVRVELDRMLRWLPPRGLRSCLKRSFLLLDVWARCGLEPRFHLGLRPGGAEGDGHAWVTVSDRVEGIHSPANYVEIYRD